MEPRHQLWDALDLIRDRVSSENPDKLVRLLANEIDLSWQQAVLLPEYLGKRSGFYSLPEYTYRFLARYAEREEFARILNPWVRGGILLTSLVEQISGDVEGQGIIHKSGFGSLARIIGRGLPITWSNGKDSPLEEIGKIDGEYDFIASTPPLGQERETANFTVDGQEIALRGEEGKLAVLKATNYLAEEGEAVFLVGNGFFWRRQSLWSKMHRIGIYPRAVVALPTGSLSTASIPVNLLIVGRQKFDRLFIAQLSADEQIDPILTNLRNHQEGARKELGILVDKNDFVSWRAIELDEQIRRRAQRSGMDEKKFGEILAELNTVNKTDEQDRFERRENAVYLPRQGTIPPTTNVEEATPPRYYLQAILESGQALAEFVERFFECEFGELLMERWANGSQMGHISLRGIENRRIYLPEISVQERVLQNHKRMEELRLQLDQLNSQLWKRPVAVDDVEQEIKHLNEGDGLENWMETLPFPIASVLRKYHAVESLRDKQGFLLDLFEATAEFFTVLMLSAFRNDEARFRERKGNWLGAEQGFREALKKSSFGNWSQIGGRIAKDTRRMLSGDEREECLELYRATSPDWIEAISSKEIYKIFREVVEFRNSWKGHSSTTTSDRIFRDRVRKLEERLNRVREEIGYAFEEVHLLKPEQMRYEDGVYHTQVKQLRGAQTFFEESVRETTVPMDVERLYLLEEEQDRPLQLLPFFKLMASPRSEENAFYFYNRIEDEQGEKVRWLSYHFEGSRDEDKSPTVESPDAIRALQDLIEEN